MEKIVGKKELSKAFKKIKDKIIKDTYECCEIDKMLIDELGIGTLDETESSGDFAYIIDVYDYIAGMMRCHGYGYYDEDITYRKSHKKKAVESSNWVHPNQAKLF